jgi:hypothetical protein
MMVVQEWFNIAWNFEVSASYFSHRGESGGALKDKVIL